MKKILSIALLGSALLLAGCNGSNTNVNGMDGINFNLVDKITSNVRDNLGYAKKISIETTTTTDHTTYYPRSSIKSETKEKNELYYYNNNVYSFISIYELNGENTVTKEKINNYSYAKVTQWCQASSTVPLTSDLYSLTERTTIKDNAGIKEYNKIPQYATAENTNDFLARDYTIKANELFDREFSYSYLRDFNLYYNGKNNIKGIYSATAKGSTIANPVTTNNEETLQIFITATCELSIVKDDTLGWKYEDIKMETEHYLLTDYEMNSAHITLDKEIVEAEFNYKEIGEATIPTYKESIVSGYGIAAFDRTTGNKVYAPISTYADYTNYYVNSHPEYTGKVFKTTLNVTQEYLDYDYTVYNSTAATPNFDEFGYSNLDQSAITYESITRSTNAAHSNRVMFKLTGTYVSYIFVNDVGVVTSISLTFLHS